MHHIDQTRPPSLLEACAVEAASLAACRDVGGVLPAALARIGEASSAEALRLDPTTGHRAIIPSVEWGTVPDGVEPLEVPVVVGTEREAVLEVWPSPGTGDLGSEWRFVAGILAGALGLAHREAQFRESSAWLRFHLDNVPVVTYIEYTDIDNLDYGIVYVSPQVERLVGYTPDVWSRVDELGIWEDIVHPDDREAIDAGAVESVRTGEDYIAEYRVKHGHTGEWVWIRDVAELIRGTDGEPPFWHGIMVDITERKELEQKVQHLAYHDSLTGLANRQRFEDVVEEAIARARRHDHAVALLFCDLNDFKPINDEFGHHAGDELLREVARRLRTATREIDLVARQGGDEFLVLLPDIPVRSTATDPAGAGHAHDVAGLVHDRIVAALAVPFRIGEHEIEVSASIGLAVFPFDASDERELLTHADHVMYRAKRGAQRDRAPA